MRIADHAARAGMAGTGKAEILAGRLARDRAARFEDPRHHGGVKFRNIALQQHRAIHHRNTRDADVILDRDTLAAQQTLCPAMDIRLPVPRAVWIFRCRGAVSRGSRRNWRKRRRDQFVEPAIRGQRSLEGLLKGRSFIGRKNEAEIRSEAIDLLQRRKTNHHVSSTSCYLRTQTKKDIRGPKRPRMASMPLLSMVA